MGSECYMNCYVAVLTNTGSTEDSIIFVDCSGFTQTITLFSGDTALINYNSEVPISGNTNNGIITGYTNNVEQTYYFSSCCLDNQVFTIFGDDSVIGNTIYGENFVLSETSEEVKYYCSEQFSSIPIDSCPPINGNLVSVVINPFSFVQGNCSDCINLYPCPQQCYGLLACDGIYDLIVSADPSLSGYVDTFVNINITSPVPESPQTLFLVKDLGVIDCINEYTFTYSASTGSCDCQCYIFKTPSEPFITSFVDCDDNLLQVVLPTGRTTSICSIVRPIFETQTPIPIKLGGLCVNGECPDQPVVTIKPRNECDVLTIFPMGATCIVTHPSTIKSFDGKAQLLITGGTPPYTISWDTGSVSSIINNLGFGSYGATITDFYNDFTLNTTCVLTAITPTTTTTTTLSPLPTYDELCFKILRKINLPKGSAITLENISMDFDGYINGKPNWVSSDGLYLLYWNTGSTPNYWDLSGYSTSLISYTTQAPPLVGWAVYGDPAVLSVTVLSGDCSNTIPIGFTATATPVICNDNGTITILATGGDGIYEYSINNGTTFGTTNIFQNLSPGTYIVHVRDGLGQTTIQNVIVGQTPAPTFNLNLQVSSSNIGGDTFTITSNISPGYTVSFDINNTSNFSYYQDVIPPIPQPGDLPTYDNLVTVINPSLGVLPLVSTVNSQTVAPPNPNCPNSVPQYNTTKQYSTPLTITNGQTITGTFTNSVQQSTIQTNCKFATGTFAITITNPRVLNCDCCPVTITREILNSKGGSLNFTQL